MKLSGALLAGIPVLATLTILAGLPRTCLSPLCPCPSPSSPHLSLLFFPVYEDRPWITRVPFLERPERAAHVLATTAATTTLHTDPVVDTDRPALNRPLLTSVATQLGTLEYDAEGEWLNDPAC